MEWFKSLDLYGHDSIQFFYLVKGEECLGGGYGFGFLFFLFFFLVVVFFLCFV